MAKSYVKNPSVSNVFLPGIGKLMDGRVLVGDEYAKFCPQFLVEVRDGKSASPEALSTTGAVPMTPTVTAAPMITEQLPPGGSVPPPAPAKQVITETEPSGGLSDLSEEEKAQASGKAKKVKS